ncbi:MAG: acyl-CoA dehydrogenase family protein, partial [Gordonia sp. (in: high G+C Gram-positive bacteria)]|nr:acyl-CoA dehydrogenase family protein [Gordonia sp. (in: high G+C Gram-positive bacteria)]
MSIATSSDQRVVADSVTDWAAARSVVETVRADIDGGGASWREFFGQVGELGVFMAGVAEDAGGAGGSLEDVAVMLEACGSSLVPGPLAQTVAGAYVLAAQGSEVAEALMAGERPVVIPASALTGAAPSPLTDGAVDLGPVPAWVDDALVLAPLDVDGERGWFAIEPADVDAATMDGPLDGTAIPHRVRLSGLTD